jgi:hypothetical protein
VLESAFCLVEQRQLWRLLLRRRFISFLNDQDREAPQSPTSFNFSDLLEELKTGRELVTDIYSSAPGKVLRVWHDLGGSSLCPSQSEVLHCPQFFQGPKRVAGQVSVRWDGQWRGERRPLRVEKS